MATVRFRNNELDLLSAIQRGQRDPVYAVVSRAVGAQRRGGDPIAHVTDSEMREVVAALDLCARGRLECGPRHQRLARNTASRLRVLAAWVAR